MLMLSHPQLLELKRWNTPTIYNGWEQVTRHDPAADGIEARCQVDFIAGDLLVFQRAAIDAAGWCAPADGHCAGFGMNDFAQLDRRA